MTYDFETTIQLPDEEDVDVCIWFEVTYWGHPGSGPALEHPGDPPEGPEFEITKVVRLDTKEDIFFAVCSLPDKWWRPIEEFVYNEIYDLM